MSLSDDLDGRLDVRKPANPRRVADRARRVVYLQMFALVPTVLLGRSEEWGYSTILHDGILGNLCEALLGVLAWSVVLFPITVSYLWISEAHHERWSWTAIPLSAALSFTQCLAILPMVQ